MNPPQAEMFGPKNRKKRSWFLCVVGTYSSSGWDFVLSDIQTEPTPMPLPHQRRMVGILLVEVYPSEYSWPTSTRQIWKKQTGYSVF